MKPWTLFLVFLPLFTSLSAQELQWTSINDLEVAVSNSPKKVLIYVTTSWCGWCKKMKQTTFTDTWLIPYLNQNFHLVKLDGEEKEVLTFKGYEFKYIASGRRGYNEMTKALLDGRLSYPSFVFLDEKLDRITIAPGYRDAQGLMSLAKYISEEIYKTQTYSEYQKGK
jgi:thioredoxin-related protein